MKPHTAVAFAMIGSSALGASFQVPAEVMESFEDGIPEGLAVTGRALTLDERRMKQGDRSLKWEWQGNDVLTFDTPIGYRKQRRLSEIEADYPDLHASPEADILEPPHGFFMWGYNDQARSQRLRIQFGRGEEVDCEFDYNLNFKGWRTIAINYDRGDMRGVPREDMTRMTINAPATGSGAFYFDVLGFSVPMNPRTVNANPQLPEIDRHPRLVGQYPHLIYEFSKQSPTFNLEPLDEETIADIRTLEKRAASLYLPEDKRATSLDSLETLYARFQIVRDGDHIYGRPLANKNTFLEYFSETGRSKDALMDGIMSWRYDFGGALIKIARAWNGAGSVETRDRLEEMFINLFEYGIDQGFDTGAGLGWIHHYSYVIRDYAPSMFLMQDVLKRNGRLEKAIEICKWFHGFNQVYREDVVYDCEGRVSGNADDMQGLLVPRLLCALMMEDAPEKARDLRHFSSYFSNITTGYANALDETFKPDGTMFHHAGHAFGYGGRAIYGAVRTHAILGGTSFRASPEARARLAKVVSTYHACLFGPEQAAPKAFASIRFSNYTNANAFKNMRERMEMDDEEFAGFRMLPYSCVGLKRQQNDWMITVRGHSKYVYPFESWGRSFFAFPLFIANGYLDVSYPDSLDSVTPPEGTWHPGLDWRRWPGATTVRLPFEQIATMVGQVRDEGGEYLLSDQPFSGGVETSYGCGIYVFPFKGHDKYGIESFTGKKSYFFFNDMVVCLGSDIRSDLADGAVETTLFQCHLSSTGEAIVLNGEKIDTFPFEQELKTGDPLWMIDNRGTGYLLPAGAEVRLARQEQTNPDANDKGMATGNFAVAWMDHGIAPRDASYQYILVADADPAKMEALAAKNPSINVLQMDSDAHVVAGAANKTTAYAVYAENGAEFSDGVVKRVNKPSTFVVQVEGDDLRLSVADPDLNIYDGQDDLLPDGTRCELSIYEREWFYWPSRPTTVHISLNGVWQMDEQVREMETVKRQAEIISWDDGTTVVAFECRDGLSAEVVLSKGKEKE